MSYKIENAKFNLTLSGANKITGALGRTKLNFDLQPKE